MKRFGILTMLASFAIASAPATAQPDRTQGRDAPAKLEGLRIDGGISAAQAEGHPSVDRSLWGATGPQQVIVRLKGAPVARGANKVDVQVQQGRFVQRAQNLQRPASRYSTNQQAAPRARMIAQVQTVLNAVFLEIDAADLMELARDPDVVSIKKVVDYELDLSETVPYIGATTVQGFGSTGTRIRVAVLDSGIDYYHAALGGSGNPADYAGDDPTIIEPSSFPTAKVVDGFDFVGGVWPAGALAPDPDPLDDGPAAGHGTHVAHIIGGMGGVAPDADLYGVKVCSSVSSSCSGIALIQGMDFSVDPNGDGDTSDKVDIINMSLGANYGSPFNDDLSLAVDNATALGVLTVSSAGNGGDKPYVGGTPAGAPTAISVAQTNVPSAGLQLIDVPPFLGIPAVFQPWSTPPGGIIAATVQYGDGAGGNLDGCAPFPAGTATGKIVLVDRGACFFSTKIQNIDADGGVAGIIGLIDGSAPFAGGFGAGPFPGIPGYMISLADANAIRSVEPTPGSIDPLNVLPQVMSMVGSSSRGPQIDDNRIKPEIGAPGASVSADAGTGTGASAFGGTSGASPMVAGAAALLLDCRNDADDKKKRKPRPSDISLVEAKSLLMNTAETEILRDVVVGDLAPITRIGGGEVRVDAAVRSAVSAWDRDDPMAGGALSYGHIEMADNFMIVNKFIRLRNRSHEHITFNINRTFRSPGPEASIAVKVKSVNEITVKSNPFGNPARDAIVKVKVLIIGKRLPGNFMNSGSQGDDGFALTANEFDGYIEFVPKKKDDPKVNNDCEDLDLNAEPIHVAWHILPRKAARVVPDTTQLVGGGFPEVIGLNNTGVGVAQNDAYSIVALSPNLPEGGEGQQMPIPDFNAVGVNTFPVPAGFCSPDPSFIWVFAINSHERARHLVQPASYQIWLDTNRDGLDDYVVLNRDLTFSGVGDGKQVSWVFDLVGGGASAFFFAEHATNTGNTVLIICGEQVGLSGPDILATTVDGYAIAQDFYYGGPFDVTTPFKITPLGEQYFGLPSDVPRQTYDPAGLPVFDFGPFPGNTPELGVLLFTNGDRGFGARGGATEPTEAIIFDAP